jgi:hypothetical protein
LCAITESVVNNNVTLLYHLRLLKYKQHQFCHQQAAEFPAEHRHYQGKPKQNFVMVRPFFAAKGTTLESLVICRLPFSKIDPLK